MRSCFRCGTRSPSPKVNSPATQLRRKLLAKRVVKKWKNKTNNARKKYEALQAFRGFVLRSPDKIPLKLLAKLQAVSPENRNVVRSAPPRILRKIGNRVHPPHGAGYNKNLTFNNRSNLVNATIQKNHFFTPAQRKYVKRFMNTLVNNARYFGEEQEHIIRHATEPNRYKLWGLNFRIKNGNMYGARNNLWHRNVKVANGPNGTIRIKFVRQNYPTLLELKRKVGRW